MSETELPVNMEFVINFLMQYNSACVKVVGELRIRQTSTNHA